MTPTNKHKKFLMDANALADHLQKYELEILDVLSRYEPFATAEDELNRSVETLRGFKNEFKNIQSKTHDLNVVTFFPLNLPLYSLVLFAIGPSYFAERVYVRAPLIMQELLEKLVPLSQLPKFFPKVFIKQSTRSEFLNIYAKNADVVIFTGKYENARIIQKKCPQALFVFNGGGVNPAVIYGDADIERAADKVFEMRTFNSGQDCAGTDAILVDERIAKEFVSRISHNIQNLHIGLYGNRDTQVGPLLRREYLDDLKPFIARESEHVVHEGNINEEKQIVSPYIIQKSISEHVGSFHEFFAPIFYILTYSIESEVDTLLAGRTVKPYSMYVTYFAKEDRLLNVTFARVLKNKIVNDVEHGNESYGGYGSEANFVVVNGTTIARPILISREIESFITSNLEILVKKTQLVG